MKKKSLQIFMAVSVLGFAWFMPRLADRKAQLITTMSDQKQITVMIDAGHGASDGGKIGVNGAEEKTINLEIARLTEEILKDKGLNVVMTRRDDSPLYSETDRNKKLSDMQHRIDLMKECNVDFVVSIHQNSYTKEYVKGPQVFYYKDSAEGEKLAVCIQSAFDLVLGEDNTRSVKPNGEYYLLVRSPVPAVICECGFLSNYEEAAKLVTPEYQSAVAKAVAEGILRYTGLAEAQGSVLS